MTNSGAKVGYRLASFFGKVNYNWDDLLLASLLSATTVLHASARLTAGVHSLLHLSASASLIC